MTSDIETGNRFQVNIYVDVYVLCNTICIFKNPYTEYNNNDT